MKIRKHFAMTSAACLLLTGAAAPVTALSVSAAEKQAETSGSYRDITWKYDAETKTLTLSGTGETGTFYPMHRDRLGNCPWGAYARETEHVIVSEGITKIGYGLFSDYYYLRSVQLPESLKAIDTVAFADCFCLTDINIPKNVTEIGVNAFYETAWLNIQRNEIRQGGDSQKALICVNGILIDGAEYGSYNNDGDALYSLDFRNTYDVSAIGGGAFYEAAHIGDVMLGELGFSDIGEWAFAYSGITSVEIPQNTKQIGAEAFRECKNLTKVTIRNALCGIADSKWTFSNTETGEKLFTGTICGYTDSTAQAYAEKYGYAFESIGDALPVKQGDYDYDDQITTEDAQAVLQYYTQSVAGKNPLVSNTQKQCADVNGDGTADVMDAQFILKYYTERDVAGNAVTWDDIMK